MLTESQKTVLRNVGLMSSAIDDYGHTEGMPLYIGEGRVVYALAAYDTLECWQYREGEYKQLDSIVVPDTLPALYGKLSYWSHSL